jgi:predicted GNAT family acetyltransferase
MQHSAQTVAINLYTRGYSIFNTCYQVWDIALFITVAITIIFLLLCAYVKIKYKFWAIQPVMHIYDVQYWFFKHGIIRAELPEKNKYCNFKSISTIEAIEVTEANKNANLITDLVHLIQTNYLRNAGNTFTPLKQHIIPYFVGHDAPSYWSFYWEDKLLQTKSDIIGHKELIGCIASRPLSVTIFLKVPIQFHTYYVDFLCVHKNQRKKGIAPELIQTHEYNQSHTNLSIQTSLFKRENELTGIVPLCVYDTYIFSMNNWCEPISSDASVSLVRCGKENLKYMMDLLSKEDLFDISITNSIGNIIELINTSNIYVYMMIHADEIVGAYFFRNPCVTIEKDKMAISCYASIFNRHANCIAHNKRERKRWLDSFVHGFKMALAIVIALDKERVYHYAVVERIGHNSSIVDDLLLKTPAHSVSATAYFFYNFAYPTFNSDNVLILS